MLLDEVRIRQVLFNLVGNAAKFTERGGIRINAEAKPSQKNGAPAKYYDLTLEVVRFGHWHSRRMRSTASSRRSRRLPAKAPGNTAAPDLGLNITKRLVEHMGGTITVQSRQGRGSTFHIVLPGVAAAERSPSTVHDRRISLAGLEQFVPSDILIAVNRAVDQLLFTGYFEDSGHRIVMAEDGETILELAEETQPAVLILDLWGAGVDGPEIARRCKANPALRNIPILLCTGFHRRRFRGAASHRRGHPAKTDQQERSGDGTPAIFARPARV